MTDNESLVMVSVAPVSWRVTRDNGDERLHLALTRGMAIELIALLEMADDA